MTRAQAIKILGKATSRGSEYDDWWVDLMDDFELYDEGEGTWPTLNDVLMSLGVTKEELEEIND